MELKNKNFLVYGTGISGISAYNFLKENGANVYIFSDRCSEKLEDFVSVKKFSDIENLNIDYAVISPGVQIIGNKNIKKLKKMGIMLIIEFELGYLFCKGTFIAVTGTNGKTTCVNLLNHILSKKYETYMCGNVGVPITSIASKTTESSLVVAEVSSFMLELISPNFSPDIAVITNITPDHISRHKTFENYYNSKLKITKYQTPQQHLIILNSLKDIKTDAKVIYAGTEKKYKSELIGDFNQQNISLCKEVCFFLGIKNKEFTKELKKFTPVKYRLQSLGKKNGITYINDSKSTNPDSTLKAIESFKKPVVALLGGSDKGNDFYDIFNSKNKIKLAIIYGETADKIENDALFMGFTKTAKFVNLNEALYHLKSLVNKGDTVLFSPACASYDEFKNYIERGECFNKFFAELKWKYQKIYLLKAIIKK